MDFKFTNRMQNLPEIVLATPAQSNRTWKKLALEAGDL
jgi:hypothetical protein